jgi:hypothetical protein
MASRSATLANALVTAISGWGSLPAGVTVARVRSVTHLLVDMPTASVGRVAVIVSSVEDQSNRGDVAEDVTIGIVVVGNCDSEAVAQSDSWDEFTEDLRDWLRTDATFKTISLGGGLGAQRKTVSTLTVADADMLDESEIFVSVTEGVWFLSVGARS